MPIYICHTAGIYLTHNQATGSGLSLHHIIKHIHHKHTPNLHEDIFREIYWARYVDWSLTTPLLLLDLAFLAGMNGADILVTIVADVIMVLTGLFAAYGKNDTQKWGYVSYSYLFPT